MPIVDTWILKYNMAFKDVRNKDFEVRIFKLEPHDSNVALPFPIELTGDSTPLTISFKGDENNPLDKSIIDFQATVNVLIPRFNTLVYEDLTNGNDTSIWCETIDVASNYKYSGWLIPDEGKRTFDQYNYAVSLIVVDPMSVMKGKEFIDQAGLMYYGEMLLFDIVNACLSTSLPAIVSPVHVLDSNFYEGDSDDTLTTTILEQLKIKVEALNDENGRPLKCYEVLDKILSSFGFVCRWIDNTLKIQHLFKKSLDSSDNIVTIKQQGISSGNFFIGNTEFITKVRAIKETSNKIEYGAFSGLLFNGRMMRYNAISGAFESWSLADSYNDAGGLNEVYNNSVVTRNGTGRQIDPYVMHISASAAAVTVNPSSHTPGVSDHVDVNTGDLIHLKVKFRYKDYRFEHGVPNNIGVDLRIAVMFFPNDWDGNIDNLYQFADIVTPLEQVDSPEQMYGVPFPAFVKGRFEVGPTDVYPGVSVYVDSTSSFQTYETDIGYMPSNGQLFVMLFGLDASGAASYIPAPDRWIDIAEVIVSKATETNGTKVRGEITYLTQYANYSLKEETKDIFLNNNTNKSIAGVLLKTNGDLSTRIKKTSNPILLDVQLGAYLQYDQLLSRLNLGYTPKERIDFSCKANNIRPDELLSLESNGEKLLPDNYMIINSDYNVKAAEQKITAYQLKSVFLWVDNLPPTEQAALLENFKVTQ